MNSFFSKHLKKPAFWIVAAAAAVFIAAAVCFLTNPAKKAPQDQSGAGERVDHRPMLNMDGVYYVDPFMPLSYLPEGYSLAGTLSAEQANNTGLEGTQFFTNPDAPEDFYTYQLCGTPVDLNTVDSTRRSWQYLRWIRVDSEEGTVRTMTLDDVRRLAEKGDALGWDDLALYDSLAVGSGLYIRSYPIDDRFYLLVGAYSETRELIYCYLCSKRTDEKIDIRTGDVDSFIETQKDAQIDIDLLRTRYPMYFDLPTDKGLTVSVWQMAENSYCWDLHAGPVSDEQTIWNVNGLSIEELRTILSTYDISPEDISVEPVRMPHSSYYYDIDEDYVQDLRERLFGKE